MPMRARCIPSRCLRLHRDDGDPARGGADLTMQDLEQRVAAPHGPTVALVNEAFVARYFPVQTAGTPFRTSERARVSGTRDRRRRREREIPGSPRAWRPPVRSDHGSQRQDAGGPIRRAGIGDRERHQDGGRQSIRISPSAKRWTQAVLIEQTLIRDASARGALGVLCCGQPGADHDGRLRACRLTRPVHAARDRRPRGAGAGAAAVARAVLGEMLVVVLAGLGIGLATGLRSADSSVPSCLTRRLTIRSASWRGWRSCLLRRFWRR